VERCIIGISAETEIDQRCGGGLVCPANFVYVVQSLTNGREAEIAAQVYQLHLTRRTLLPHDALHIGAMGIEVVGGINNENNYPLASHSNRRRESRHRE
jgi:hypothetical protein